MYKIYILWFNEYIMQVLSIKDTREKLADVINQVVVAEEESVVTKFGKPKAMLVPMTKFPGWDEGSFDEVFGAWRDRKEIKVGTKWVRNLRAKMSLRTKDE